MTTIDDLKRVLSYDPLTGGLLWRAKTAKKTRAGRAAGHRRRDGYVVVAYNKKRFLAHRLAWAFVYGRWPKQIDHKDRNPSNNRIDNLREATQSQNIMNAKHRGGGLRGTYKSRDKWAAQITVGGKKIYLGTFISAEQAHAAYCEKAAELHGEFFCAR